MGRMVDEAATPIMIGARLLSKSCRGLEVSKMFLGNLLPYATVRPVGLRQLIGQNFEEFWLC